jgi:hypothetical protein
MLLSSLRKAGQRLDLSKEFSDPKVLPTWSERCVTHVSGPDPLRSGAPEGTISELFSGISCQRCITLSSVTYKCLDLY